MNQRIALNVEQITKSFINNKVLKGVSFDVAEGEVIALLGPSGCGKSTLLFLIAGLEKPDQGAISWQGHDLSGIPSHQRDFGLMFQDYALFPHMNVVENIAFGLQMDGKEQQFIRDRVSEVLDLVNLRGYEQREISTLSGGEAQRVALARALAPQPVLLMLDEPLGSIDRTLRERLLTELGHILRQLRQTAIYVTHDQEEAFAISDRVVLLRDGYVEQIGEPQSIYQRPSSRFVAEFLGLTNFIPGTVKTSLGEPIVSTSIGDFPINSGYQGKVTILLHPNGVTLGTKENFQLAGRIVNITFRGNTYRVTVDISSQLLNFDFLSNEAINKIGETIYLNFDPDRTLHIFQDPFNPITR